MLEKLLEYQKIDRELLKIENEFRKSAIVQQRKRIQLMYDEKYDALRKMAREIQEIASSFEVSERVFQDALAYEEILNLNVEDIASSKEFAALEKSLQKYEESLNAAENEVAKLAQRLAAITVDERKTEEQLIVVLKERMVISQRYKATQLQTLEKAKPIRDKLDEIKAQIPEKLMTKYLSLRADKRIPYPFVTKYVEKTKNCYACGMEVSVEVGHILSEKGRLVECPNCHRLLYSE